MVITHVRINNKACLGLRPSVAGLEKAGWAFSRWEKPTKLGFHVGFSRGHVRAISKADLELPRHFMNVMHLK